MKTIISLLIGLLLTTIFLTNCKKESQDSINKRSIDYTTVIKKANVYMPQIEPKEMWIKIQTLISKSDELKKGIFSKSSSDFGDLDIYMAKWLLETTLNTEYANFYDTTVSDFQVTPMYYTAPIIGNDQNGVPVVGGQALTTIYNELVDKIAVINSNADSTFFQEEIHVFSIDESSITFQVLMNVAHITPPSGPTLKDEYAHIPWVLTPYETPVPFVTSASLRPIPVTGHPDYAWAGSEIGAKLNAHRAQAIGAQPHFIIQNVYPIISRSYNDYPGGDNLFWHTDQNLANLNATQLNTYLTNYDQIMNGWNTPYGYNNYYISYVEVDYVDTFSMWPPPYNTQGANGQHYFHVLDGWQVQFINVPGNTK